MRTIVGLSHGSRDALRDDPENDYALLDAHGLAVGLEDGLMGNSEVGHLNIGAGRVVWQDIVRINEAIKKKKLSSQKAIVDAFETCKKGNGRMHFLGLVSDGGVHSHINHLFALLDAAKEAGIKSVYVHAITDGRDTSPRSASEYIKQLEDYIKKIEYGTLNTIVGRYYAMDRDKRWERVKVAVDALVSGEGEKADDAVKTIEERYSKDETDEFLKPIILNGDESRLQDGDSLFTFNYRSDRMREIASVLGKFEDPIKDSKLPNKLNLTIMTRYNTDFKFPIAFPPQVMSNVLAEAIASQGASQCHLAETEKYAHVTFFFNGGIEKQFENEDRVLVPSPKVATYDKQPRMSVHEVADKVAEAVKSDKFDFVICNFAPPDMVGHTGVYEAAVEAITETDKAVDTVHKATKEAGYVLLITADHGNAEQMLDPDTGKPHTAHTTNPVPFIMSGGKPGGHRFAKKKGALCDVAPTVLALMGLNQPAEMDGSSLIKA